MAQDMNDRVAAYRGLVESLAARYVGWNGAELDDLVQEGLIEVWKTLKRDKLPNAFFIEKRMSRYARWLGRQLPVPYEEMLPLDDFRDTHPGD